MTEDTKALVASNLTVAFYSRGREQGQQQDFRLPISSFRPEDVFATYEKFVGLLDKSEESGFVGVPPESR